MRKKHNYPENRQPRDVSYSQKYKAIEKHGLDQIKEIWKEKGMYRTGKELDESPYVIRDIVQSQNWTRPAEKAPRILKGVESGKMPASHYKSLDFSGINLNINTEENDK